MQGTAADIIKKAMIDVQNWLITEQLQSRMIMQVHDELVFEIANNELSTLEPMIKKMMQSAFSLRVPLIVDIGTGKNWDEAH
jgi:DNA polymerase-1